MIAGSWPDPCLFQRVIDNWVSCFLYEAVCKSPWLSGATPHDTPWCLHLLWLRLIHLHCLDADQKASLRCTIETNYLCHQKLPRRPCHRILSLNTLKSSLQPWFQLTARSISCIGIHQNILCNRGSALFDTSYRKAYLVSSGVQELLIIRARIINKSKNYTLFCAITLRVTGRGQPPDFGYLA